MKKGLLFLFILVFAGLNMVACVPGLSSQKSGYGSAGGSAGVGASDEVSKTFGPQQVYAMLNLAQPGVTRSFLHDQLGKPGTESTAALYSLDFWAVHFVANSEPQFKGMTGYLIVEYVNDVVTFSVFADPTGRGRNPEDLALGQAYLIAFDHQGEGDFTPDEKSRMIECFEKTMMINPQNAIAAGELAVLLTEHEGIDQSRALRLAEQGIAKFPYHANFRLARGKALKALGRPDEAREEIKTALEMGQKNHPNNQDTVKESQKLLASWN